MQFGTARRDAPRVRHWLDDPANVVVGSARVIWADDVLGHGGEVLWPSGWVLPGGKRTRDRAHAVACAESMAALMARH